MYGNCYVPGKVKGKFDLVLNLIKWHSIIMLMIMTMGEWTYIA
jgi:hypothetical protein